MAKKNPYTYKPELRKADKLKYAELMDKYIKQGFSMKDASKRAYEEIIGIKESLAEEVLFLCVESDKDSTKIIGPGHSVEGDIKGEMIKDQSDAQRKRKQKGLGA